MNMRQRLRRWLGIDELRNVIDDLRAELDETQFVAGTAQARHDSLRREVEELGILATATKDALETEPDEEPEYLDIDSAALGARVALATLLRALLDGHDRE